jgi:mannan endo-1,4-beta-mannosidase
MKQLHHIYPVITLFLFSFLYSNLFSEACAQSPVATVEAENGVHEGGITIGNSTSGYSGTGYVTDFKTSSDKVTVTMNVPNTGFYKLVIRYYSEYKEQYLYVNSNGPSIVAFPNTAQFKDADAGKYLLNAGNNTFTIQSYWGWIHIDKFSLYSVPKNTYSITPNLIDTNANSYTNSLYQFLVSNFNVRIISGQTDCNFDQIKTISGKTPMLRAFDFQSYTQGYPYLWKEGVGHTFGWVDNGQTQKAIDWYNQTNKVGIISFQWHWHSPSGGTAGTNTFYTNQTSFDVTRAVQPGNQEYTDIIRDIDSIATQLKKLQNAGVPVLWRPLHEAGGGWFWWGAKGPEACKKLYRIIYNRLTDYHLLHNLIWVWSTPETDWYPGNDSVDIVGYDSYPGAYNYTVQENTFYNLYNMVRGEKLIAMTENGPIPDPEQCFNYDAPWAYFMSWCNLVTEQNTNPHITDVFNHPKVLTIETPTDIKHSNDNVNEYLIYPNPAIDNVYIKGVNFKQVEIYDLNGFKVHSASGGEKVISTKTLKNGVYTLKIYYKQKASQHKLLINR